MRDVQVNIAVVKIVGETLGILLTDQEGDTFGRLANESMLCCGGSASF